MERPVLDVFYYEQGNNLATVLVINLTKHSAQKIKDCPLEECESVDGLPLITERTASIICEGLMRNFFFLEEVNYKGKEFSNEQKRRFYFHRKLNEKYQNAEYKKIIEGEQNVHDEFYKKRIEYTKLCDKYAELLQKCDLTTFSKFINKYQISETMPEAQKTLVIASISANSEKNGFDEVKKELLKDKNYVESEKVSKEMTKAYFEFLKSLLDLELYLEEENKLFTEKYLNALDLYAEKGLFLYFLPTPDFPIDDPNVTIDDFYNYLLEDDCLYLNGFIETFVKFGELGEINKREADDLVASFNSLLEGKYWASLRNLYSLLDHHHKFCSELFNGYQEEKKKFRNGKERSEYITKLIDSGNIKKYEKLWEKLNLAIQEINQGSGTRFVSRNSIVHGDYEKEEINPTAKDVINVLFIYVTLRRMIDYFANVEEAIKEFNIYLLGYAMNH